MNTRHTPPVAARVGHRITPTLPSLGLGGDSGRDDNEDDIDDESDVRSPEGSAHRSPHQSPAPGLQQASYSTLLIPQRVEPSTNVEGLYDRTDETSDFFEDPEDSPTDLDYRDSEDDNSVDASGSVYRLAFRPPSPDRSQSGVGTSRLDTHYNSRSIRDQSEAASRTMLGSGGSTPLGSSSRDGQTSVSAIVIQDSPTPPLRPLASPQARLAASSTGRCAALGDVDAGSSVAVRGPEKETSMNELVCPICLGPPTPLVVTECGHTFCGPCLHAAMVAQPITQQLLRDLPTVAGKNLEGTCPVCRHVLSGGWGQSLRGAILKMDLVDLAI